MEYRPKRDTRKAYRDYLKDYRWLKFSHEVKQRKGEFCKICGLENDLQVHHMGYWPGLLPWEYQDEHLQVLCRPCHNEIHTMADDVWNEILKVGNKWVLYEIWKTVKSMVSEEVNASQVLANLKQRRK